LACLEIGDFWHLRNFNFQEVGERVVREELQHKERAEYGKKAIEKLAKDLMISRRLIFDIVKFYRAYQIVHTLCAQLSWSHYRILSEIKNKEKRRFYEAHAVNNMWSKRELERRIKNREYEKARKKGYIVVQLPKQLPAPEDVFKENYDWDFLELEKGYKERDLERGLLENIEKLLLELGNGFAFMKSQYKIVIAGQYHKIDMIFYHRFLRCIVIVELKTEKFHEGFVGQMNKYLTYIREHDKLKFERDPIGLIICKEKDEEEVYYALGKLSREIFVAEYKAKLPTEQEIKSKLKILNG